MSLVKRGKTWHTHFFVDGQRFRQSLDTSDWREAQAREKVLIAEANQGKLTATARDFARLTFSEGANRHIEGRKLELSPSSLKKESQLLVQPKKYFGTEVLARITPERLLAFREWRVQSGVGPATINMEIGVVRRILKRAKRWHLVGIDLKPLKEPRSIGRAMTLDEKLRLLRLAGSNADWQTARLAATLALNTTMRGCEIKQLRWRDIDLIGRTLAIRKGKTDAGERTIPLNSVAYGVVIELRERAKGISGAEPQHFVFPSCENGHIDPDRPQKSWRTAWRRLTAAIECPRCRKQQDPGDVCRNRDCAADIGKVKSTTAGLRFHDLRHHAITELAESQASDSTIMAIAGHVSPKMLAHYSHVRLGAKRSALDALAHFASKSSPQTPAAAKGSQAVSYDTNNATKVSEVGGIAAELLEKNGRPEWTRTS